MRIATWNINSLRLRMPMLGKIVKELEPDVVCLQETVNRLRVKESYIVSHFSVPFGC
jgi:exonuclease III